MGLMSIISFYCLAPLLLIFALDPSFLLNEPRMTAFYLLTGGVCLTFFLVFIPERKRYSFKKVIDKPEKREPSIIIGTDSSGYPVRLDDGSLSTHQLERINIGPGKYQIIIYDRTLDEEIPFDPSRSDHREFKKHLDLFLRNYKEEERVLH